MTSLTQSDITRQLATLGVLIMAELGVNPTAPPETHDWVIRHLNDILFRSYPPARCWADFTVQELERALRDLRVRHGKSAVEA